jgi:hypothetical protein
VTTNCTFFPNAPLYGGLSLTNNTVTGALRLVLTSTSTNAIIGYSANDTRFVLVNSGADCRQSFDGSTGSNSGHRTRYTGSFSLSIILLASFGVMTAMILR